ncbi:MAG: SIS domain-containing protein [Lachnospiraceae bacterium]|nr:SIS domain-containing protein [Lachnospiraceae bacterium]
MEKSMLTYREIYRQPEAFESVNGSLDAIYKVLDEVFPQKNAYDEVLFIGCGTSLYLAQTAAHMFASCTDIPAKGVPCSEIYFFPETYLKGKRVLICPITRKSYTTEVRMAIDRAHMFPNVKTLAITCDKDSSLYNDFMILSPDADEESVVMTSSFTSMVYLAAVMAYHVGGQDEKIGQLKDYKEFSARVLRDMDVLAKKAVEEHPERTLFVTLGQGVYYGVARECMNKMKEMGLVSSEGYYDMEYRHGPMSLVDDKTMIVYLSHRASRKEDVALARQMQEYGALNIVIGAELKDDFRDCASYTYSLDGGLEEIQYAPVIGFIGQFLGYYIALRKGLDADTPRNLSQAIVLK